MTATFHARQCADNADAQSVHLRVRLPRAARLACIDGTSVYETRLQHGRGAREQDPRACPRRSDIDVVIPIPDSSRPSAMRAREQLGLTYREGFVKNRYIGRTFIMPGQAMRKKSVRQKLNAIGMEFKGKNVLLVDDSIVRGTTSREIVQMAREAGARKVYFASAAPPVRYPERLRHRHAEPATSSSRTGRNEAEIAREIGADLLIYQDLDALKRAVRARQPAAARIRGLVLRRHLHHRRHHRRLPVAARGRPQRVARRSGPARGRERTDIRGLPAAADSWRCRPHGARSGVAPVRHSCTGASCRDARRDPRAPSPMVAASTADRAGHADRGRRRARRPSAPRRRDDSRRSADSSPDRQAELAHGAS